METYPSILIVDDEPALLFSLSAFFEDENFKVFRADSGESALELLTKNSIDIAILDMRLPVMSGNEVIEEACRRNTQSRFLIHTGSLEYTLPISLRQHGITEEHVIIKPVYDLTTLLNTVNSLLQEKTVE